MGSRYSVVVGPVGMPSSRPLKLSLVLAFASASLAACGLLPRGTTRIPLPSGPLTIEASGQSSVAALNRFPPGIGLRFGGVSSLFPASQDRLELIGVSDDRDGIRDENDLCPNDAEDKDGRDDADGCPDR